MELFENIAKIYLILALIILSLGILLILLTEQEESFYTYESCEQLRECVLMDIFCLDRHVENKFLSFSWEFDDKAQLSEQKDYYKLNCHDKVE